MLGPDLKYKVSLWIYHHKGGWTVDPSYIFSISDIEDPLDTFGTEIHYIQLYTKQNQPGIFMMICLNEIESHVLCPDFPSFLEIFPMINDILDRFIDNDDIL